ncbi:hypothetical protein [Gordonia alkaliphila]|uniref:Helix-turn-helix domain-containing protein n=1 Tax=Gordonia alkaliphila TaxID=1053547 RepID=A0ABP8Z4E3_9ACTN
MSRTGRPPVEITPARAQALNLVRLAAERAVDAREDLFARIAEALAAGVPAQSVADAAGVSVNTVRRLKASRSGSVADADRVVNLTGERPGLTVAQVVALRSLRSATKKGLDRVKPERIQKALDLGIDAEVVAEEAGMSLAHLRRAFGLS